jgi:hypothetical protein
MKIVKESLDNKLRAPSREDIEERDPHMVPFYDAMNDLRERGYTFSQYALSGIPKTIRGLTIKELPQWKYKILYFGENWGSRQPGWYISERGNAPFIKGADWSEALSFIEKYSR